MTMAYGLPCNISVSYPNKRKKASATITVPDATQTSNRSARRSCKPEQEPKKEISLKEIDDEILTIDDFLDDFKIIE